ncbi:hypothetical protein GCM10009628_06120 [Paeniglutamicibacter kerguelensis]
MGVMQHHRRQLKRLCSQGGGAVEPLRERCLICHTPRIPGALRLLPGNFGGVDYTESHAKLPIRRREPQMVEWITWFSFASRHSVAYALMASRLVVYLDQDHATVFDLGPLGPETSVGDTV